LEGEEDAGEPPQRRARDTAFAEQQPHRQQRDSRREGGERELTERRPVEQHAREQPELQDRRGAGRHAAHERDDERHLRRDGDEAQHAGARQHAPLAEQREGREVERQEHGDALVSDAPGERAVGPRGGRAE